MSERLRQLKDETGVALVMALAFTIALSALVFGMITYVTGNQKSAANSSDDQLARSYAEAALDTAYSTIVHAKNTVGLNPASANLLGCAASSGGGGDSDCTSTTPICINFTAASCPSPYTATAGTATVVGFYTGTSATDSYAGITPGAGWWILVATGYVRNSSGLMDVKTIRGTVQVKALDQGAVASVWNHVFLTAPKVNGSCGTTFSGNTTVLNMPVYSLGNLCFTGNSSGIAQVAGTGIDHIDLQVGGLLYYGGNGDFVGTSTTKVDSAYVKDGCATTAAQLAAQSAPACVNGASPAYYANGSASFTTTEDPELTDAQVESDYTNFDPGPKHACLSGTNPAPLAANTFDYSSGATEGVSSLPNNSGSGSAGGVFDLTPASNYACISTSGTGTGYIVWNNGSTSLNVTNSSGTTLLTVPSKTLLINGSIYVDGQIKISQSMTYKGVGVVMSSGNINFPSNSTSICAYNTSCLYDHWQGSTSNNDMLTLATVLASSTSAINWTGNGITWQGSLWCRPSSTFLLTAQGNPQIQGPLSCGKLNIIGNSFTFKPLPVINDMPVGAPVPPNVSAQVKSLNIYG